MTEYKAEIEEKEMENFKAKGFEVGFYGNQFKRDQSHWEWYKQGGYGRGVRYYPAVFFKKEDREKIEAMGGKNIAPVGH